MNRFFRRTLYDSTDLSGPKRRLDSQWQLIRTFYCFTASELRQPLHVRISSLRPPYLKNRPPTYSKSNILMVKTREGYFLWIQKKKKKVTSNILCLITLIIITYCTNKTKYTKEGFCNYRRPSYHYILQRYRPPYNAP